MLLNADMIRNYTHLKRTLFALFFSSTTFASDSSIPSYDATASILMLPTLKVEGRMYGGTQLRYDHDGAFSLLSMPVASSEMVSASSYSAGTLVLASLMFAGHRYTNAKLSLRSDGKFTLTNIFDPVPVQKSSYENKAAAAVVGSQYLPAEVEIGNAVAYADFFQDGSLSMVTHTLVYSSQNPATAKDFGEVRFYRKISGAWVDQTALLLAKPTGCLHPRKAIVADFNNDGQPDVFFACHGFDAAPFPGEQPVLLLSQADGTYLLGKLPYTGFFHSASAADINGDGYVDILVTDNMIEGQPYFLINNGNGSFTKDTARLPITVRYKPIFTAELLNFFGTGKYDVLLAGHEQDPNNAAPVTVYPNDGTGNYITTKPTAIPAAPGFGFATDAILVNGALYLARTIDLASNFYGGAAVQKVSYPSLTSQVLFQQTGWFPKAGNWAWATSWINWIAPYQSSIVAMDRAYQVSLPQ